MVFVFALARNIASEFRESKVLPGNLLPGRAHPMPGFAAVSGNINQRTFNAQRPTLNFQRTISLDVGR